VSPVLPTDPGWYDDPEGKATNQAYWNGEEWTGETRPGQRQHVSGVGGVRRAIGVVLLLVTSMMVLVSFDAQGSMVDAIIGSVAFVVLMGLPGLFLAFPRAFRRIPWGGIFLVAVGSVVVALGFTAIREDNSFARGGVETTGVLVENAEESCSGSEGQTCTWSASVAYTLNSGEELTRRLTVFADSLAGDTISIQYLSDDPQVARSDAPVYGPAGVSVSGTWIIWVVITVGFLIVAFGVVLSVAKFREEPPAVS